MNATVVGEVDSYSRNTSGWSVIKKILLTGSWVTAADMMLSRQTRYCMSSITLERRQKARKLLKSDSITNLISCNSKFGASLVEIIQNQSIVIQSHGGKNEDARRNSSDIYEGRDYILSLSKESKAVDSKITPVDSKLDFDVDPTG